MRAACKSSKIDFSGQRQEDSKMQVAQVKGCAVNTVLYTAMELSNSKWKSGFANGSKLRRKYVKADRMDMIQWLGHYYVQST